MATVSAQVIEWHDVQGMVLRGYGEMRSAAYLVLRVDDLAAARGWIGALIDRVTTAEQAKAKGDDRYLNVAFTRSGLSKLGFIDALLAQFSTAFLEGMASENRTRILGDTGESAPANWTWGRTGAEADVLLLIFAKDPATLDRAVQEERDALKGVSLVIPPLLAQLSDDDKEHFGFHDGISQPIIEGSPKQERLAASGPSMSPYGDANVIKAGEFLLGYLNEYGQLTDPVTLNVGAGPHELLATSIDRLGETLPDFGRNGTYLVARQIEQHVARFWTCLDKATRDLQGQSRPAEREKLASKVIGRWPSGVPMAVSPDRDDSALANENEFVYQANDPHGFGCPLGSHIRRTNLRDSLGDDPQNALKLAKRHRLIRRGRSYGPRVKDPLDTTDSQARGLFFICLNANIERQFEFVQQTWANNSSFDDLYGEQDPILSHPAPETNGILTIPAHPVRQRLRDLGGFTTIRGGAYFFLPGIRALRYLAAL